MRKRHALVLFVALLAIPANTPAQPAVTPRTYVVIAHPANPTSAVSRQTLADMFLKRTTRWDDGTVVVPADREAGCAARASFSEEVLHRSVSAVRSYWQQIIFSGRGVPPVEVNGDAAAVRFVLSHRGAVAYVSASANVGRAKILEVR